MYNQVGPERKRERFKVDAVSCKGDKGPEDVGGKRVYNAAESAADQHSDGQLKDIALDRKTSKFGPKAFHTLDTTRSKRRMPLKSPPGGSISA